MKITFLGHAAFLIETDQFKLMIDPFLENGITKMKVENFPEIDYILVTHGHGDHIGSTVEIAKQTGATVILNPELAHHLQKVGVKTHTMHIGGKKSFEFGSVKMIPALHGSSIMIDGEPKEGGNPCGFLIEIEGKAIYHAGDTGVSIEMQLLESEKIDFAMLPIGGNFTMDIKDALKAVQMIKPIKVMPMHYNTFPVIQTDVSLFMEGVKALKCGTVPILLEGDASYEL
ncbi:metal-dependent hydrolase [Fusibacter ferrireducens]|uniref:UPF0173 metal-dependent hydrolase ISU02_07750 n=1 Tax=Fusibacter ferrireducens TaxID=2785058 RepID=A0ABR9ZRF1_9FIRM|nr:metal-dependent hydrolase [Fusibacter ferrireducens]MBF4693009.1 metal-dependent hydrolase [Fusibacter ferrireducens]